MRLPTNEDTTASIAVERVANNAIREINTIATEPNHAITTGSHNFNLCTAATTNRPVKVEAEVANKIGRKTKVGSGAPCCRRYIKIETGSKVSDDAFKTKNKICALVANKGIGLSSCRARIAFKPMGVAALSKPKAFAVKFKVINPNAG